MGWSKEEVLLTRLFCYVSYVSVLLARCFGVLSWLVLALKCRGRTGGLPGMCRCWRHVISKGVSPSEASWQLNIGGVRDYQQLAPTDPVVHLGQRVSLESCSAYVMSDKIVGNVIVFVVVVCVCV